MRYGFYLPTRGPTATREGILALAREGEPCCTPHDRGPHRLPIEPVRLSPHPDHKHPGGGDALETFSILGVVRRGNQPGAHRKDGGVLDVCPAEGPLVPGVGWWKEEFEALDSPISTGAAP
jgi:hypothetical protein